MRQYSLVLVVTDLWYFALEETQNLWLFLLKKERPAYDFLSQATLDVPKSPFLLTSTTEKNNEVEYESLTEDGVDLLFQEDFVLPEVDLSSKDDRAEDITVTIPQYFKSYDPAVMYVSSKEAFCFVRPEKDFDTVLAKFLYGTAVTVIGYQGSYAKVFWSHHEGWILKDNLTPNKAEVWPHLTNGNTYEADDDLVKKLRLLIDDTFCAGELGLPLQAGEWVMYRLREQNRLIPWPVKHGRLPGDWQILLKGVAGTHIGVVPKLGSIMEWRGDDGIGRVAYVEKITPEQALVVTSVGFEDPGKFEEKNFLKADWLEMRPVFIEVF